MIISEHLYPYFYKAGKELHYLANDIIYLQEDQASQLYLVIKGRVKVFVISKDGQEIVLEILEKGRIFGESSLFHEASRPVSVCAVNEVTLISCRLNDLYPFLLQSKELLISLMQHMSSTCDYLTEQIKRDRFYDRYEKTAGFIIEYYYNHPNSKYIPYSHEEIGYIIGLNRVTITNILKTFQQEQLIDLAYRKIYIKNIEGLERKLTKKK